MSDSDEVRLISESVIPIKELKGFSKGGRVPNSAGPGDVRYVVQLAKADFDADLEEKFGALRSAFGLKRKQLQVAEPDEGLARDGTPYAAMYSPNLSESSFDVLDFSGFSVTKLVARSTNTMM